VTEIQMMYKENECLHWYYLHPCLGTSQFCFVTFPSVRFYKSSKIWMH